LGRQHPYPSAEGGAGLRAARGEHQPPGISPCGRGRLRRAAYDNAFELIADPAIDLIVVAVKVTYHAELVSEALAAGKMVYGEWPLAVDLDEAIELAAKAEAAGVRTVVGLQGRYAPAVQHARHLVQTGYVGDVHSSTRVGSGMAWGPVTDHSHAYLYDDATGASTLTASAMHAIDAAAFVLGEPTHVTATLAVGQRGVRLAEDGSAVTVTAPDQVAITATLDNSAVLSAFYRGGVSRGENLRWHISGSKGELVIGSSTPGNGNLQAIELTLEGATGDETALHPIDLTTASSATFALAPGLAGNVARVYVALKHDLDHDMHTVPDFGYVLELHRLVAEIRTVARDNAARHDLALA
jgi:predicted dehydrogenase